MKTENAYIKCHLGYSSTTIKEKTTILTSGASPEFLAELLCLPFFGKQSHQVPVCHVSGSTRFMVVAGTDKKPLGLTNKDAHVGFLSLFFYISSLLQVNCSMSIRFSSAITVANVIGIYETCPYCRSFSSSSLVLFFLPSFLKHFHLAFTSFFFSQSLSQFFS